MASAVLSVKVEERFAAEFQKVLRDRYGKIPSAAFVAGQFNRRITSTNGVSQESVRRWMRRASLPKYQHLEVLAVWLSLDVDAVMRVRQDPSAQKICCSEMLQTEPTARLLSLISSMPLGAQHKLLDMLNSVSSVNGEGLAATIR